MKNYIIHDDEQKIPPIRESRQQNVPKDLFSSAHSRHTANDVIKSPYTLKILIYIYCNKLKICLCTIYNQHFKWIVLYFSIIFLFDYAVYSPSLKSFPFSNTLLPQINIFNVIIYHVEGWFDSLLIMLWKRKKRRKLIRKNTSGTNPAEKKWTATNTLGSLQTRSTPMTRAVLDI